MKKVKSFGDKGARYPAKSPFIIAGHLRNAYPTGNDKMEPTYYIPNRNIGQDFDPNSPWRMYHGDKIPGFPVHPHRGFETITIVEEGVVDHTDSYGGNGRYAKGDVQWLTAGAGIQHCEMFPLINKDKDNPFEIFQLWLNLPKKNKMVPPHYKMIWNENIPVVLETDESGNTTKVKVIHGIYKDVSMYQSTPDSWAADPENNLRILLLELEPMAKFTLNSQSNTATRMLYYYEGKGLKVEETNLPNQDMYAELIEGEDIYIENGAEVSKILILESNPINEPVASYGPFVMNTEEEIKTAIYDYRKTEFGGWKWNDAGPVHPRDKGRFAEYTNGIVEYPKDK